MVGGTFVELEMAAPAGMALAPDDGMVVVTDAVGRGARKRRAVFPVGNTRDGVDEQGARCGD